MPARLRNIQRTSRNICASLLLCAGLFFASGASAQGLGGFAFENFTSEITVNQDGSFDVGETIRGEFFEFRHGLFRNIPVRYEKPDGGYFSIPLAVRDVRYNGEPVPYEVSVEGSNKVIKIGDPDETVIGPFTYEIFYHVDRAILYDEENDELYWNVTGTEWGETIPQVTARIRVPVPDGERIHVQCFTGEQGSREQDCEVGNEGTMAVVTAQDFLTISVRFPKGVVEEPTASEQFWWWFWDNWDKPLVAVLLPTALVFLVWVWWRHGRDMKGRGTIIAEYEPPEGFRPTEVGTLLDTKVHPTDFSAGMVDLAVRGYFQIVEQEEKGLFGMRRVYSFKKKKDADDALKPFEKKILDALFGGGGEEVTLKDREVELAQARDTVAESIPKALTADRYFVRNPATVKAIFRGLAIALFFIGWFVGILATIEIGRFRVLGTFILIALLLFILALFMPKKTKKGTLAFEHAKGFKLFLETAEKYRMQWQEKEGVFEKFLPYAMVFGVVGKWAAVFKDLNLPQPTWYVGSFYATTFNPVDFGSHVSSLGVATNAVQLPSSSGGGGGFGGGGFSGGGFGGGGGGSW